MKRVTVIGTGIGAGTLTAEAADAIARAEVLLGARRLLADYGGAAKTTHACYLPADVAAVVRAADGGEFAVLVSGDVGFYSAAAGLAEALADCAAMRFLPGISTVNALFARLGLPWQDAAHISAHGRAANVADIVRRNRLTFCLTGGNVNDIGAGLVNVGLGGLTAHVGENLGLPEERVYDSMAEALSQGEYPSLTALLLVNEDFDDRVRTGIPDSEFVRLDGIPMTKSEVRAVIAAKLAARPDDVCWDVGAGTGSVTVELALSAYRGQVCAIERRADAMPLIAENCKSFHIGNVTTVCGDAPDALCGLPAPDVVFIGGSGGELRAILKAAWDANLSARICVAAVTVETVGFALSAMQAAGHEPDIVQLSAARGKKAGRFHLMEAMNPITILCAGGGR